MVNEIGEIVSVYYLGTSEPWHGAYCERQIRIAVFGLTPPSGEVQPPSSDFCHPVLLRSPTGEERTKDGKDNQPLIVEGLHVATVFTARHRRFYKTGAKTGYVPLI